MSTKNTFFYPKTTLNCNGKILDLSQAKIMGILNVTPDSFYDGGRYLNEKTMLKHVEKMIEDGADFIDVGGMSSRPGAKNISEKEELKRVIPAIHSIKKKFPNILVSIDTFRAKVVQQAVDAGASIVNDISAGSLDKELLKTVAHLKTPYILMHMKGTPSNMQKKPFYKDVANEVLDFFIKKITTLRKSGINDIIIDPGFGFGKTLTHNYELLKKLDYFKILNLPILVGVSRKSMINKLLKLIPEKGLNGTTVLHTIALLKGARILRVHDVKEAKEAIKITEYYSGTAV